MQREITKWKSKHKLLSTYNKEEEVNFKEKFDLLINVEESRAKIKETIIKMRYGKGTPTL